MINSNPQYNDLIDSYLDNSMSSVEQQSFMNELHSNEQLKKEYVFQLEVQDAIADPDYDAVRETISNILNPKEYHQKTIPRREWVIRVVKYAAVISTIVISSVFLTQYFSEENSSLALVDKYFEPYPAYNTFRGESTTAQLIESAFSNYELNKYKEAESAFAQLSKNEPSNMAFVFYQANAFLSQKEFEQAEQLFAQIIASDSDLFSIQSKWYQALCALGRNDMESAKSILNEFKEDDSTNYHQQAVELLRLLE